MAVQTTTNLGLTLPYQSDAVAVSTQNDNMETIDAMAGGVESGLAIVSDGNTHAAITAGQFVYVRNHLTLAEGLYKASSDIAANATLSSSNLTACSSGGMNDLKADITTLNSQIATKSNEDWKTYRSSGVYTYRYEDSSAASTYDLPWNYVFVTVTWQSSTRAVAIAQRWDSNDIGGDTGTKSKLWIRQLHNTWNDNWREVAYADQMAKQSASISGITNVSEIVSQTCYVIGSLVVFSAVFKLLAVPSLEDNLIEMPYNFYGRYDFAAIESGTTPRMIYCPSGQKYMKCNSTSMTSNANIFVSGVYTK